MKALVLETSQGAARFDRKVKPHAATPAFNQQRQKAEIFFPTLFQLFARGGRRSSHLAGVEIEARVAPLKRMDGCVLDYGLDLNDIRR